MTKTTHITKNLKMFDADWYKALSDDDCIVCLTEKQVYLLSCIAPSLTWVKTRWSGDTNGLDVHGIQGDLIGALTDKMTCQKLTDIMNAINLMQGQIQQILGATNPPPQGFDPDTTTANDVNPQSEMIALELANQECDTTGKDAIYGAIKELVSYIHNNNNDLLQQLEQDVGNIAEQSATIISAIPIVGLLPIDEKADYISFITNELKEEYEAQATETLLQNLRCDLFCIAVANGCRLTFDDLFGYFADRLAGTISNYFATFADIVNFSLTGSFAGDDYFYVMCFTQLQTIMLGGAFLGIDSPEDYALISLSGQNSPDNDWSIFCTDCPTFEYWEYYWDIVWGLGEFSIFNSTGELVANGVKAVGGGDTKVYDVRINFDEQYNIARAAIIWDANTHIGNGSDDWIRISGWVGQNWSVAENVIAGTSFIGANGEGLKFCGDTSVANNNSHSMTFIGSMTNLNATSELILKKIRIIGRNEGQGKPALARWRQDAPLCTDFT